MQTTSICKSEKTMKRINTIQVEIKNYRESIKLLLDAIENNRIIDITPFAPRIIKYSCIPRSERRFKSTLLYIKTKVKILERELETLIKYGE